MSRMIGVSSLEFFIRKRLAKALVEMDNESVYPTFCKEATCGAKTRSGSPCRNRNIYPNGRCKFHGGPSTGPKTLEGKRRSALNTGKTYEELVALSSNNDKRWVVFLPFCVRDV